MPSGGRIPRALTIAGSDSGGGAGIQADLKTFEALGVYGMSAITAVTAQNTVGVSGVQDLPPDFVAAQIEAVVSDIGVDAVKVGMLSNAAIIDAVADTLGGYLIPYLVVDPVMVAKSGDRLLQEAACDALKTRLLPMATVVTPNAPEAAVLAGLAVEDEESLKQAAAIIHGLGPRYVLVKGGHLPTPEAVDWLFDGGTFRAFPAPRHDTPNTHGTGCTFSSAIAAYLALGFGVPEAVAAAKAYVTGAIERSLALGHGHGPLCHRWRRG